MTIHALRTSQDHAAAVERLKQLWDATAADEKEEFDILFDLVEAYERRYFPTPPVAPIEAIKFRMEQLGLKPTDLAAYLGYKSRVSEILSGKRQLTVKMMQVLHQKLGVPAESLLSLPDMG